MITCSQCGFRNMDGESRCLKCQSLIVDDPGEVRKSVLRTPTISWRERIGFRLQSWSQRLVRASGWHRVMALPEQYVPYRLPMTAGGLSLLFPGLGQIYNRQPLKALIFGGFMGLLIFFAAATITHPASNLVLLGVVVTWCGLWTDAYVTAARINGQQVLPRAALAVLCGILAVFFAVVTLAQYYGAYMLTIALAILVLAAMGTIMGQVREERQRRRARFLASLVLLAGVGAGAFFIYSGAKVITLKKVFTGELAPLISGGDVVMVNHLPYRYRSPLRGEILYYDPDRFTMEVPGVMVSTLTSVNLQDYFQRVVAVGGDRVRRQNGVCYVNDTPVPREWDAFRAEYIGDHGEFVVPQGRVYAPITRFPGDLFQGLAEALGDPGNLRVGVSGVIYKDLDKANMPGRSQWLGRGLLILNPPPHRRTFPPRPQ